MPRRIKTVFLAILTLVWISVPGRSDTYGLDKGVVSNYHGRTFTFDVSLSELRSSPDWNETAGEPPLSPRQAAVAASRDLQTFVKNTAHLRLAKIALYHVGAPEDEQGPLYSKKWYYLVVYEPKQRSPEYGTTQQIWIPVLMDGKAIKPTVTLDSDSS